MDKTNMSMAGFLFSVVLLVMSLFYTDGMRADLERLCTLNVEYFRSVGLNRVDKAQAQTVAKIFDTCRERGIDYR